MLRENEKARRKIKCILPGATIQYYSEPEKTKVRPLRTIMDEVVYYRNSSADRFIKQNPAE